MSFQRPQNQPNANECMSDTDDGSSSENSSKKEEPEMFIKQRTCINRRKYVK